jgi:hypothetical protein
MTRRFYKNTPKHNIWVSGIEHAGLLLMCKVMINEGQQIPEAVVEVIDGIVDETYAVLFDLKNQEHVKLLNNKYGFREHENGTSWRNTLEEHLGLKRRIYQDDNYIKVIYYTPETFQKFTFSHDREEAKRKVAQLFLNLYDALGLMPDSAY